MTTAPPPLKKPPIRETVPRPKPEANGQPSKFTLKRVARASAHRIVIYGTGGIGKTSLAMLAPGPVGFIDLENSLGVLQDQLPDDLLAITENDGVTDWATLRNVLQADIWAPCRTIVIDSATKAEEWAAQWTLRNIPTDNSQHTNRLEGYGWGKGYKHLFETYLTLFQDLDAHIRAGRNVVIITHELTTTVPNPAGPDFLRYEPKLQSLKSGEASIRLKMKEWADHLLFVGYDIVIDKDGIAQGGGSRTIYPRERPFCMAKSRTLADPIQFEQGNNLLWTTLFGGSENA